MGELREEKKNGRGRNSRSAYVAEQEKKEENKVKNKKQKMNVMRKNIKRYVRLPSIISKLVVVKKNHVNL